MFTPISNLHSNPNLSQQRQSDEQSTWLPVGEKKKSIVTHNNSENERELLTLQCLMMLCNEFKLHARNQENHQSIRKFVMQYTNTLADTRQQDNKIRFLFEEVCGKVAQHKTDTKETQSEPTAVLCAVGPLILSFHFGFELLFVKVGHQSDLQPKLKQATTCHANKVPPLPKVLLRSHTFHVRNVQTKEKKLSESDSGCSLKVILYMFQPCFAQLCGYEADSSDDAICK